jgi:hypothetical protein
VWCQFYNCQHVRRVDELEGHSLQTLRSATPLLGIISVAHVLWFLQLSTLLFLCVELILLSTRTVALLKLTGFLRPNDCIPTSRLFQASFVSFLSFPRNTRVRRPDQSGGMKCLGNVHSKNPLAATLRFSLFSKAQNRDFSDSSAEPFISSYGSRIHDL